MVTMWVEEVSKALKKGKKLEEVLEKLDWKEFERFVAHVFEKNLFKVVKNFRFRTHRRYEIDLLATKRDMVFCVDCKEWCKGRFKTSPLKVAVQQQEERIVEFKKFLTTNPLSGLAPNFHFIPLIVTLFEEELLKEGETFIVPIWKLNTFLLDF